MLKHAPDTAPASACHKRRRSAGRTETGRPSPERRSRSTSDKSPVRESRTPGSAGEVLGNRHLYPTIKSVVLYWSDILLLFRPWRRHRHGEGPVDTGDPTNSAILTGAGW